MKKIRPRHRSPVTYSGKPLAGVLLEPIVIPNIPDLWGIKPEIDAKLISMREQIIDYTCEQELIRIQALLDHYQIQEKMERYEIEQKKDSGVALCLLIRELAKDFLPGFQVNPRPKANRPKGSYTVGGEELFGAVLERVRNKHESIKDACTYISRHNRKWRGHSPKALETAYHRYFQELQELNLTLHQHSVYGPLIRIMGLDALLQELGKRSLRTMI